MNRHRKSRATPQRLTLILLVLSTVVVGASRAGTPSSRTLDRDLEPVIVSGAALGAFQGASTDEIFVYGYTAGQWEQLPAQIDEVSATGTYTTTEDSLLDANDELVFMAMDLGDRAPGPVPAAGVRKWYEIEVTDPSEPSHQAWAYVVHSAVLTPTFVADYVDFDTFLHRIKAADYNLGFATPKPWMDYFTFNGSVVDILDRAPKNRLCYGELCLNESLFPELQDDLIVDGPVRLIIRNARVLAYGSMASWTIPVADTSGASSIRFSTDFNSAATGATYYNAAVPNGVTVDGIPDSVSPELLSSWWQISTDGGTLIQVADTASIGGTQSNYYLDDSNWDQTDTGDKRHYGDTGVYINDPELSFTYIHSLYILPGRQPNVGQKHAAHFSQPLSVTARLHELEMREKAYVPLVVKTVAR